MATTGPTNLPAYFSSAADFQAWVQGIHSALSTLGLVQTTDTGQINPATVAAPTATSQMKGYEIWRFSDTLQSSVPVFFKIEYGSGSASLNQPGISFTIGSGSDGAGNLTGQVGTRQANVCGTNTKTVGTVLPLYASTSSDKGEFFLAFNLDFASTQFGTLLFVSRLRDSSGAVTSDGVFWGLSNSGSGNFQSQFVPATGTVPNVITAFPIVNPTLYNKATAGSNTVVCPPMLPINGQWRYVKMATFDAAALAGGATLSSSIFGGSHTFMSLGQSIGTYAASFTTAGLGASPGFGMPWE